MSTEGVASGLRVLQVGPSLAVAVAGMVLADHGAEVTVIERPGGCRLQTRPAHRMWSRGKRRLELDLESTSGAAELAALASDADVAVVAVRPTTAERLGLDGDSLRAGNDRLVHASITGFGDGHPWRDVPGYEGVVAARGGRAHEFAVLHDGQRPAFPAVPVATHGAAMLALGGIFAALHERTRTGRGQCVRTSLLQALSVYDLANWVPGATMALRLDDVPSLIYPVARTADGVWVQFAQNSPTLFRALMTCLELSHLYDDERFATAPWVRDPDDARALRALLLDRVRERTWAQWQEVFATEPDVSAEPFVGPGAVLDHPQAIATGDVRAVEDPVAGPSRQLGPLGEFAEAPPPVPPPATTTDPTPDPAPGGPPEPLLGDVTVLELATWIATPLATALLAELGARVVKIEPHGGDPMRAHGPVGWKCVQGKESLVVDLKTAEGRDLVRRLVARADVLVHNFRPGVPERLGIDAAALHEVNPRLVHVYAGSYGSRGPMSDRPAFHVTFGAIDGGVVAQLGADGLPESDADLDAAETARWSQLLTRANDPNPDFNAALATAAAIGMGIHRRDVTGRGQVVETRMLTANAYAMSEHGIDFPGRPPREVPDADRLGLGPRYRLYPAAEGWVFVAVPTDDELEAFGAATGLDGLAALDPAELTARLTTLFESAPADEWETRLTAASIACARADIGPLPRYAFGADWAEEMGLVVDSTPDGLGPYRRYGAPVTGERSPGPMGAADAAGAQTRAILTELGVPDEEIERLAEAGVVGVPQAAIAP